MKPLFVSALYHPNSHGGSQRVAQAVAEGMLGAGHQPVVVTTDDMTGVRVDVVNGVKVYYVGLKNIYWPHDRKSRPRLVKALWHAIDRYNPWMVQALSAILDSEEPDVVNTHSLSGFSCAVWPVIKQRHLPLIHTLHDYSLICPKASMFKEGMNCGAQCAVCKVYSAPSSRYSECVDEVVGVSRFILDRHLAQGYFQHAATRCVIYNGVPGSPGISGARPQEGQPLRLGYVGQLNPQKGISQLISVMHAWPSSQCRLTVAGQGLVAYEEMLRQMAPESVSFLGFVDPSALYRNIDVLVVPSLAQEPLGMIVLEAYMHGVPVIAANRGGLAEIVDHGKTGLLYDPASRAGLKDAITAFLRDRSMITRFRPQIEQKARYFVVDRMVSEYLHVLEAAQRMANTSHVGVSAIT
jgi:glycosyltransferase involved in cell wall biosynthesis